MLCPPLASASLESLHLFSAGANSRGQGTVQRKGHYEAPGGGRTEGISPRRSSPGTSAPHSQVCPPETPKRCRGRLPEGDSAPGWHHGETRQNARDQPLEGQTLLMERGNHLPLGAPSGATRAAPRGGGLLSPVARDQCQIGMPPEGGQVDWDPSRLGGSGTPPTCAQPLVCFRPGSLPLMAQHEPTLCRTQPAGPRTKLSIKPRRSPGHGKPGSGPQVHYLPCSRAPLWLGQRRGHITGKSVLADSMEPTPRDRTWASAGQRVTKPQIP